MRPRKKAPPSSQLFEQKEKRTYFPYLFNSRKPSKITMTKRGYHDERFAISEYMRSCMAAADGLCR